MDPRIRFNIRAHNRVAARYQAKHVQIFNPIEQARAREHLLAALAQVRPAEPPTPAKPAGSGLRALDFGCGSGNLTAHLLDLGLTVTAADVAPAFLARVKARYPGEARLTTWRLNGTDLAGLPDGAFDLAAAYAVLHHVPDYLRAVSELARVVRPGGVVMIDREAAPAYWNPGETLRAYQAAAHVPRPPLPWSRFLKPATWIDRFGRWRDPRYEPEGDIHVWPDDHLEWDRISEALAARDCRPVHTEEYLDYDGRAPLEVYERFRGKCATDMLLIARKGG